MCVKGKLPTIAYIAVFRTEGYGLRRDGTTDAAAPPPHHDAAPRAGAGARTDGVGEGVLAGVCNSKSMGILVTVGSHMRLF
jgi:hypothetical protein